MKKVINITLGGIIFAIEDDAFEALSAYLKSIETKFASSPDYEEISEDIEDAIAEKFRSRGKNKNNALTKADVDAVVGELGTAEEVGSIETESTESASSEGSVSQASQTDDTTPKRRLYRDIDEGIIAGVSSGLAKYFDIDPVIVRALFILAVFANGLGILAYIVMWLIVPAAKTTADKYAMRGERMTVTDITERVKKNLSDEKNIEQAKGLWGKVRNFLVVLFDLLGKFLRAILHFLRYAIGILLIVLASMGVMVLVAVTSIFWMPESTFVDAEVMQIVDVFMQESPSVPFIIAAIVSISIPLIVIMMLGASLFAMKNFFTLAKSISLFVVWVISMTIVVVFGINYGPHLLNELEKTHPQLFEEGMQDVSLIWDENEKNFKLVNEPDTPKNEKADQYKVYAKNNAKAFKNALESKVIANIGQPIEGFRPFMFMEQFPNLIEQDFDEVKAMIGHYEYENGKLVYELGNERMVHSAAEAITEVGYERLLQNVAERLEVAHDKELSELLAELEANTSDRDEEALNSPDQGVSDRESNPATTTTDR